MSKKQTAKNHYVELDYKADEKIKFVADVFQLTIAANLTKQCSPLQLNFCLKQCILVFFIQFFVSFFFVYELLDFERFQPVELLPTVLRVVASLLLQQTLFRDLQNQLKMLTFLKRMKGTKKHSKGRLINFMLCTMQMVNPIMALLALMITLGQEIKL